MLIIAYPLLVWQIQRYKHGPNYEFLPVRVRSPASQILCLTSEAEGLWTLPLGFDFLTTRFGWMSFALLYLVWGSVASSDLLLHIEHEFNLLTLCGP